MKKVAFIGGYDKADLILYVAKILTVLGKRVMYVDGTLMQKVRYIAPTMTPAKKYITTYDGIDIAIGFDSMEDLKEYCSIEGELAYDYLLGDLDNADAYINFGFSCIDLHYFVTTFDVFSVQRGMDVLSAFESPTIVQKVLFTKDLESEESEYLDFVSMKYKVKWKSDIIFFPFETKDLYAIYNNQRFSRVRFDNISSTYMDSLAYIAEQVGSESEVSIRKAIKIIDRA